MSHQSAKVVSLPGVLSDPFDPELVLNQLEQQFRGERSRASKYEGNDNKAFQLDWAAVTEPQWKSYPCMYKSPAVEDAFCCFFFLRYQLFYFFIIILIALGTAASALVRPWYETFAGWFNVLGIVECLVTSVIILILDLCSYSTRKQQAGRLEELRRHQHDEVVAAANGSASGRRGIVQTTEDTDDEKEDESVELEATIHQTRVKKAKLAEIYAGVSLAIAVATAAINYYRLKDGSSCTTNALRCQQEFPVGMIAALTSMACFGARPHLHVWLNVACLAGMAYSYLSTSAAYKAGSPGTQAVTAVVLAFCFFGCQALKMGRDWLYRQMFISQLKLTAERRVVQKNVQQVNTVLETMLPPTILPKLLNGDVPDTVQQASVLVSDVCGFTKWCSTRSALQVVEMLSTVVGGFDLLALEANVIRIKTMGDGYLATCGIPVPVEDHADCLIWFATKIQHTLTTRHVAHIKKKNAQEEKRHSYRASLQLDGDPEQAGEAGWGPLTMRIGLHSGAVIGTMVSMQRWAYDVLGPVPYWAGILEQNCKKSNLLLSSAFEESLSPRWTKPLPGSPIFPSAHVIKSDVVLTPDIAEGAPENVGELFQLYSVEAAANAFRTLPVSETGQCFDKVMRGEDGEMLGMEPPKPTILEQQSFSSKVSRNSSQNKNERQELLNNILARAGALAEAKPGDIEIIPTVDAAQTEQTTTTHVVADTPPDEKALTEPTTWDVLPLQGTRILNLMGCIATVACAIMLLVLNLIERSSNHDPADVTMKALLVVASLVAVFVGHEHRWKVSCGSIFLLVIPIVVTDSLVAVDNPVPLRIAFALYNPLWLFVIPSVPFALTLGSTLAAAGVGHIIAPQTPFDVSGTLLIPLGCVIFHIQTTFNLKSYLRSLWNLELVLAEVQTEINSLSGLLKLKMPEHVIDKLLVRMTGEGGGQASAGESDQISYEFSSCVVAFLRFDVPALSGAGVRNPSPGRLEGSTKLEGDGDGEAGAAEDAPLEPALSSEVANLIAVQREASTWVDDVFSASELLDKVKTMGDTFMIAGPIRPRLASSSAPGKATAIPHAEDLGGPLDQNQDQSDPARTAEAILEIVQILKRLHDNLQKRKKEAATSDDAVSVRGGAAVGPVIAAVIGTSQLEFDVFGSTVNLASRVMNSTAKDTGANIFRLSTEVSEKLPMGVQFDSTVVGRADLLTEPFALDLKGISGQQEASDLKFEF